MVGLFINSYLLNMDEYNFYKYIDDKSILVITAKNKLIRIRCPFAVKNVNGEIFQVNAVTQKNGFIYYEVGGKNLAYHGFLIL